MARVLACGAFLKNTACILDTDAADKPTATADAPIRPDGTYLVTGGTGALGLQLAYDAQAVQAVSVLEGSFLRQGGVASTFSSRVETGRITVNTSRAGTTGASTEAPLLTLNLRASMRPADGQTTLQLASISPLGVQGRALGTQALPALVVAVQP